MDGTDVTTDEEILDVRGEDTCVRYHAGGDGPPVVFLHGIGLDAATVSWRHVLPALADERSVYALDLPGHGGSDPPAAYTTDYFVDVLAAFLDRLDLRGADLAGLSMGGAVALGYAMDGGSPASLVLVDSYGLGSDAYWRQAAGAAVRFPFASGVLWGSVASRTGVRSNLAAMTGNGVPEDLVEDVYRSVSRTSVRTLQRWQRAEFRPDGFRTDYTARLADLSVPTLLVHGSEDPLFPVSWSRRASETLPNGDLCVVENCGHWPPREQQSRFNGAIRSFLGASTEGARRRT